MQYKVLFILISGLILPSFLEAKPVDDEYVRQIVGEMLREKDKKIEQLEARIQQLEAERRTVLPGAATHQDVKQAATEVAPPQPDFAATPNSAGSDGADAVVAGKLRELSKKDDELKASAEENGLVISGFFDVNAKTGNSADQTFSVGSVELDLDYAHDDHFGASTALVFTGDADPTASSGADFAVAMVDYHLFNDRIPPRGRIFNNQGFHIQAGRFDLPFGTDYQNFASKDRITITAPLTTTRIQQGGYNADGIRSYGSWGSLNYSAFWTNALYASDGATVGGRLGVLLGQNTYTIHHNSPEGIEFGISHISEFDGSNNIRNTVYGADLSIGYGMLRLQSEFMLLQAHQQVFLDANGNIVTGPDINPFGKGHQLAYHTTLIADLQKLIHLPVMAFARYSRWDPTQTLALDFDESTVAINDISMLSLGFNYKFSDHLRVKFEYDDTLGTRTAERYFDKRVGIAQIVMSF
jgi:hypothetical protein